MIAQDQKQLTWRQLTSLTVGGAICLPVVMAGHALCQTFGLLSAIVAVTLGNAIALLMGLAMSWMSVEARLPTTDNARNYFGPLGTRCFAAALLFAKCCWIAIQLNLMAMSLRSIAPWGLPDIIVNMGLGLIVIAVAIRGIEALSFVTSLSLPILVGTLGYTLMIGGEDAEPLPNVAFTAEGISVAIATVITAVIDMPTYFRHARSHVDSLIAVIALLGIGVPMIEGVGIYLSYNHPGSTVMETLQHSSTPIWNLWVALFLMLAGWSTNNSNLFSAVASLGTLCPRLSSSARTIALGVVGIALSTLGLVHHFAFVLQLAGVAVGSMGCIILVRFILGKLFTPMLPTAQTLNLCIWALAECVGIASVCKIIHLTGIPLIDACAVATLGTTLCHLMIEKRIQVEAT